MARREAASVICALRDMTTLNHVMTERDRVMQRLRLRIRCPKSGRKQLEAVGSLEIPATQVR